jgi:hypothetical protein
VTAVGQQYAFGSTRLNGSIAPIADVRVTAIHCGSTAIGLAEAARLTGKNVSTIHRVMKAGPIPWRCLPGCGCRGGGAGSGDVANAGEAQN